MKNEKRNEKSSNNDGTSCRVLDGRTITQLMNGNAPALLALSLWITWQKFSSHLTVHTSMKEVKPKWTWNEIGFAGRSVSCCAVRAFFRSSSYAFDSRFYHKTCKPHEPCHAEHKHQFIYAFVQKRPRRVHFFSHIFQFNPNRRVWCHRTRPSLSMVLSISSLLVRSMLFYNCW